MSVEGSNNVPAPTATTRPTDKPSTAASVLSPLPATSIKAMQGLASFTSMPSSSLQNIVYAGFWNRLLAMILDGFILSVSAVIIALVTAVFFHNKTVIEGVGLLIFIVSIIYYIEMEASSYQATIGKLLMGIKVVDLTGNKISVGRSAGRFFSKYISSIFLIGFLMQPFTKKKQALHDMIAGTLVIKTQKASAGKIIMIFIGCLLAMVICAVVFFTYVFAAFSSFGLSSVRQITASIPQHLATSTVSQTAQNAASTSMATSTGKMPASFSCLNVQSVKYSSPIAKNNSFFIGWGNSFIDPKTSGDYGKITSVAWVPLAAKVGTNTNLVPLTITPFTQPNSSPIGTLSNYRNGIMSVVCTDGKKVSAYIPDFVYKQTSVKSSEYINNKGMSFNILYVAADGSTYYDAAMTKLARSASN